MLTRAILDDVRLRLDLASERLAARDYALALDLVSSAHARLGDALDQARFLHDLEQHGP